MTSVLRPLAGAASAFVLVIGFAGCSTTSRPDAPGASRIVIAEAFVEDAPEPPVAPDPETVDDTHPLIAWIDVGERFSLVTRGSSSCPSVPASMTVDGDALRIGLSSTGGPACTSDKARSAYAIDLPAELRGRDGIDVVVEAEGGERTKARLER
jgi:hypothetical protein